LVQRWLEAKAALRGEQWRGTHPRHLMRLAERSDLRLVESGIQLLEVLEESLLRLEAELQGELRSVVGLWNESSAGNQPKSEGHLANEVVRHLRRDLQERRVVIGRELILQIGIVGGAAGLRTDIDVVAQSEVGTAHSEEVIRAVIEVKGSWNPDVSTAMNEQLVQDYMDPHRIRYGLYLVGYYTCGSWKMCAARSRSVRLGDKAALTATLIQQARGLTTPLRQVRAFVLNTALPDSPDSVPRRPTRPTSQRGKKGSKSKRRSRRKTAKRRRPRHPK
jgi:hypothetical protein